MSVHRVTRWSGVDRLMARALITLLATNFVGVGAAYAREPEPSAISIASEPAGANVYVDGQALGTTPIAVKAAPGDHRVRVEKDGFLDNSRVVSVASGSSRTVQVKLTPDNGARAAMPIQVESDKSSGGGGGGSKKALLIGLGVVAVGAGAYLAFHKSNKPPTVGSVSATPSPALAGTSVSFSAQGSDPDKDALSYTWSFGDGGSGTGASTTHTYTSGGSFSVGVTVSDGKLSASGSTSVTVKAMSGTWRGAFNIPGVGSIPVAMSMNQNGSSISGGYADASGFTGTISGTVSGTNSVRISVNIPGFQAFVFSGTTDASVDRWTGSITGSGLDGSTFSLSRQ